MNQEYPKYKVAAVQAAPVFLDLQGSVDKACDLIREAGRNGAKVIGFPEAFLPGFPNWIFVLGPDAGAELYGRLYRNALLIPGKETDQIGAAAKDAGIYVCMSATERDGGSLYLCQLWFDPSGKIIGKHRKLKPTGPERYVWGDGDGSMFPVFETPLGNLGGLLCWENMLQLPSAAMAGMNEEVHVASRPSGRLVAGGPFVAQAACRERHGVKIDPEENQMLQLEVTSRWYAMATQSFVIMASGVADQTMIDALKGKVADRHLVPGGGNSGIISPDGQLLSERMPHDQEGLVYAEIPLEMTLYAKYMCDPGGHYSVPSVLQLSFDRRPRRAVRILDAEAGIEGEDQDSSDLAGTDGA